MYLDKSFSREANMKANWTKIEAWKAGAITISVTMEMVRNIEIQNPPAQCYTIKLKLKALSANLDVIAERGRNCLFRSSIVKLSKHLIFYSYFSAHPRKIFAFSRWIIDGIFSPLIFVLLFILAEGIFLINNLQLRLLLQSFRSSRPDAHEESMSKQNFTPAPPISALANWL